MMARVPHRRCRTKAKPLQPYNRVKGELEDALRTLDLQALVLAQPSLLLDLRDGLQQPVTLQLAASNTQSSVPVWGGTLVMGYSYAPQVTFNVAADVGADSGLMLALALFDRVTDGDLVGGQPGSHFLTFVSRHGLRRRDQIQTGIDPQ